MDQGSAVLLSTLSSWLGAAGWREAAEALFVAMSVVGQHHISRRKAQGFYFWIVGNVAALALFASLERWMACLLYIYFLGASVHGLLVWRRLDALPKRDAAPEGGAAC